MSNPYFQFKDFTIWHDKCAMKVGTDSVLLGAWAPIRGLSALDIGSGTGILTIMLASRSSLFIHALDIDESAVIQTIENSSLTKWTERITAEIADIRTWHSERKFDTIISNPPFYKEKILPDTMGRLMARNTCSLNYEDLVKQVAKHLSSAGVFSVVLPKSSENEFRAIAVKYGLHPQQSLEVTTVKGKVPKRILLAFSLENSSMSEKREQLSIYNAPGIFSDEYKDLVKAYYLYL